MNFNIPFVHKSSELNYKKLYRQALRRKPRSEWDPSDAFRHWATAIDSLATVGLTIWIILAFASPLFLFLGTVFTILVATICGVMMDISGLQKEADNWYQPRLPITFHLCHLLQWAGLRLRSLFANKVFDLNNPRTLVLVIGEVEAGALQKRDTELLAIRSEQAKLGSIIFKMASLIDRMKHRIGQQDDELSQLRLLEAEQGHERLAALLSQFGNCERTCQQQYASLQAVLADLRDKHALADELQTIAEGQIQYQQSSRVLQLVQADLSKIQLENQRLLEVFGEVRDQRRALTLACQEVGYSTDSKQEIGTR